MYTGDETLFPTETDPGVTASCPGAAATLVVEPDATHLPPIN